MNFQCEVLEDPVKVFFVNPLIPTSQLILLKILSGEILGQNTLVDLILMVYFNETSAAEALKTEIERCAFSNTNSIKISTDLPRPKDADIFCVVSDFENPNHFAPVNMENETQFDTLYLLTKFANHLEWIDDDATKEGQNNRNMPIFFTDGLLALDILVSLSKNLPHNIFVCPSPIEAISKFIMGDYLNVCMRIFILCYNVRGTPFNENFYHKFILKSITNWIDRSVGTQNFPGLIAYIAEISKRTGKVKCNEINEVRVWAANDKVFHIEVEKPIVVSDKVNSPSHCDLNTISNNLLHTLKLDYTQINSSWLRKEFLEKVAASAARNPYGCIYKAAEFAKSLKQIWKARTGGSGTKVYSNMGVISDGSIGTMKGYPYVLPIILHHNEKWEVNTCYSETTYLKLEIRRINKTVKEQREKFIPYCKKFLEDNVINLAFVPKDNGSGSTCDNSSSSSLLRKST